MAAPNEIVEHITGSRSSSEATGRWWGWKVRQLGALEPFERQPMHPEYLKMWRAADSPEAKAEVIAHARNAEIGMVVGGLFEGMTHALPPEDRIVQFEALVSATCFGAFSADEPIIELKNDFEPRGELGSALTGADIQPIKVPWLPIKTSTFTTPDSAWVVRPDVSPVQVIWGDFAVVRNGLIAAGFNRDQIAPFGTAVA